MAKPKSPPQAFELMDCALITLAAGKRAINLRELRDRVTEIDQSSIYYHFFENLLRPSFDDPEYRNDFALWAKRSLHDSRLAEMLGIIDPVACPDMEDLRRRLLDVIEDHLAEHEFVPWSHDGEFHFLTSRLVVFNTGKKFSSPAELGEFLPRMGTGSIYFHFIDARRRPPKKTDDFSAWLAAFGPPTEPLCKVLGMVDYYFWTLTELRGRVAQAFEDYS